MAQKTLFCPTGSQCAQAGAVTASILLCSTVFLNISPLLHLLRQCPLCLCLVSGCLGLPRLLIQITQHLVGSGTGALPSLHPGQADELEVPALLAQLRLGMTFGQTPLLHPHNFPPCGVTLQYIGRVSGGRN